MFLVLESVSENALLVTKLPGQLEKDLVKCVVSGL